MSGAQFWRWVVPAITLALSWVAPIQAAQPQDQFDLAALVGICTSINSQERARDNPAEYAYEYEKKIYLAARVDFKSDSGASARAKLQAFWRTHQRDLRCQANNFNVRDGSVLKYAANTRGFGLLDDAARVWHVDLNIIDPSDGRTVLDYVESLIPQFAGTATGTNMENYRQVLSLSGAKHARDLSPAEISAQRAAYVADLRWHAGRGDASAVSELAHVCAREPASCK